MRKQKGFTLIELLIVVAIIGIIAAIAIPNLLDAIERSRQKRSTSEVKSLANAMQTFSTDYGGYPNQARNGDPANAWIFTDAAGSPAIIPDYIQAVPPMDGWKVPYTFNSDIASATINPQLGDTVCTHFSLGCVGSDRNDGGVEPNVAAYSAFVGWLADTSVAPPGTLQTHCYDTDIVWSDSAFLQAPDGKQKNCA